MSVACRMGCIHSDVEIRGRVNEENFHGLAAHIVCVFPRTRLTRMTWGTPAEGR